MFEKCLNLRKQKNIFEPRPHQYFPAFHIFFLPQLFLGSPGNDPFL
jgi:hypothetical protein